MSENKELEPIATYKSMVILPREKIELGHILTPQDHFAFSPIPAEPFSLEGAALLLLVGTLAKTPEGQKSLERIIIKYLDSCSSIIEACQDACDSNWLTALNNQHITAGIAHRIGLMTDGDYSKTVDHYRSVFDKMLGLSAVQETFAGISTLVKSGKGLAKVSALSQLKP